MAALARHMYAAAHPMLPRLWHFSADWQSHRKNRRSNDQDNAARQRRDHEPRRDETFDFVFPGLSFDAARNEFVAHIRHQERIPIAALHPNFPYAGYKLEPNAQIFLVKRSGHVTAVLNVATQPQGGGRW